MRGTGVMGIRRMISRTLSTGKLKCSDSSLKVRYLPVGAFIKAEGVFM